MTEKILKPGQILTGTLFNEPMRVETVRANGPDTWIVGLVGTQSERFRSVTLTSRDIEALTIFDATSTYDGDSRLLRLGLQAYSLGIAYEYDPYFGLSISRVDPLPHQKRVFTEVTEGTLGADFDRADRADIQSKAKDAEEDAKDEVWGGYRFAVIFDSKEADGLTAIDLGAGHASSGETLCGRVITALKSKALLNESVGAGYIERNWPPALKDSGTWPLASLRQSFLNGSLTRLLDPDTTLRNKIVEFIGKGDFGLASGQKTDGTYERVWFEEPISLDEVTFEAGVFLLTKAKAKALRGGMQGPEAGMKPVTQLVPEEVIKPEKGVEPSPGTQTRTLRLVGTVPPEIWNRLGTKIIPKLKSGSDLKIGVDFSVTINAELARGLESDLRQIIEDLGLKGKINIE